MAGHRPPSSQLRQVNQLGISTHVVYSSNSRHVSFKCLVVCATANAIRVRDRGGGGSEGEWARVLEHIFASVAGRELFLNRTTLNDFLLNYAALTFNYVNGKVL